MPTPYRPDNWSWLNRWLGDGFSEFPRHPVGWQLAASWVPPEDRRRLAAYTICGAFLDGTAHYWQPYMDYKAQRKWREYGDAQLFATQARSAVLGDGQTINVEVPELPDADDTEAEAVVSVAEVARQDAARQWLLDWADQESLTTRLLDAEYDAMGLGDCVYALGFDGSESRPRLRVYDPGWYFPDPTSQGSDDDYPRRVHLAWEEADPDDPNRTLLRRRTWELMPLAEVYPDGALTADYPWNDAPSAETVLYWDGTWDISAAAGKNGLYQLDDDKAAWTILPDGTEAAAIDLAIDFIPVVHIPNGSPGKAMWGRPVWWSVVRLLDDIAASDTDAQVGSEMYGSGALLDKGTGIPDSAAGPGSVFRGTESSDARFVDMSAGMRAMVEYRASQRDLASVNSRLPAEMLGRVKASEVPSGLAIKLAWSPAINLVRELRQVRDDKYTLLLKFAMRLAQRLGVLEAGVLPRAELKFGQFLPTNLAEAITNVTSLLEKGAISLETGVQMLVDAGVPIEDAHEEVRRINQQAYARAVQLLDASGDEQLVRNLLRDGELGEVPDAPAALPLPAPNLQPAPPPPAPPA